MSKAKNVQLYDIDNITPLNIITTASNIFTSEGISVEQTLTNTYLTISEVETIFNNNGI